MVIVGGGIFETAMVVGTCFIVVGREESWCSCRTFGKGFLMGLLGREINERVVQGVECFGIDWEVEALLFVRTGNGRRVGRLEGFGFRGMFLGPELGVSEGAGKTVLEIGLSGMGGIGRDSAGCFVVFVLLVTGTSV